MLSCPSTKLAWAVLVLTLAGKYFPSNISDDYLLALSYTIDDHILNEEIIIVS